MAFASFGATSTKSPAPAFSFATSGAPATKSPAPAFSFATSGAPAAAPSTRNLFGSSPAPAPATGGFFGSTPAAGAPAPAFGASPAPNGGIFGNQSPAPAGGSLFGGTPTAAPAPGLFGAAPTPATAASTTVVSGQTPYASLPPDAKRALDTIYDHIMRHRRAIIQVNTMAPQLLRDDTRSKSPSSPADVAAGVGISDSTPLPVQLADLQRKIHELKHTLDLCGAEAVTLKNMYEASTTQAVMYGKWPVEAIAVREGVKLKASGTKVDPNVQKDLKELLDQKSASVDRVQKVPSPYMWEVIQDLDTRLLQLQQSVTSLQSQLQQSRAALSDGSTTADDITSVVQLQTQALVRVAGAVARIHEQMEQVRVHYRRYETGKNVLDKADVKDLERQRRIDQQMRVQYAKAAPSQPAGPVSAAPAPTGIFGSTPAPATGGLFGKTPAPAAGGLFGGTPAPSAGGLFGSTPAPAPGSLFGAPAPATTAPAPGGSLFGAAPVPAAGNAAPATGGFGSTVPAPGPFSFSSSSSNVSTPKSKSKSRSGPRR